MYLDTDMDAETADALIGEVVTILEEAVQRRGEGQ